MKDSNEYDAQALPVSGPFAGLDPAQMPVIVDEHGKKVADDPNTPEDPALFGGAGRRHPMYDVAFSLAALCETHVVQIEIGTGKPVHRIVLGGSENFTQQLAQSLDAALLHHSTK